MRKSNKPVHEAAAGSRHPGRRQPLAAGLAAVGAVLVAACAGAGSAAAAPAAGASGAAPVRCAPPPDDTRAPLRLHVPSPDWRDQILYFVMTDRFADGDPGNNDQGVGAYAPGERARYNGGDLRGLVQRLDYICGLGATGLWITPPVANQWLDPAGHYAGYHGYWAEHFAEVDRHLGTLQDYRLLSHALHSRGMTLVQDIVLNHTGNYFSYRDRWRAGDPAHGWEAHDASPPVPRPRQSPFDRNDPRDPAQRADGIYHWTPDVADYTDPHQELNFQMSGLDDLNTENPAVKRALRASYGHWIREVGVDAFRVDTAFYVPPGFFADFLHAPDAQAPGVLQVARGTGRRQFHVFGEGFGIDKPFRDEQARKIERWMTGPRGQPLLPGMLNFPLYGAFGDVFARGRPPAELGHRITQTMRLHARPHLMPTFVDNHDVDRFLAGGSTAALRQALLAMMTLPGIPVIYYGTEQGFTEPRAAMFAAGWGSGGRDHYDTEAPLYRDIAAMSALRRSHRVFTRGIPTVRRAQAAQPGAMAWTMRLAASGAAPAAGAQGPAGQAPIADPRAPVSPRPSAAQAAQTALVVFNTAEHDVLLDNLPTGLPAGMRLQPLYGLDGLPAPQRVGAGGRLTLKLPPRSGWVWLAGAETAAVPAAGSSAAGPRVSLDPLRGTRVTGDELLVTGRRTGADGRPAPGPVQVVLDGDLAGAVNAQADASGHWQARLSTAALVDPGVQHRVSAWAGEGDAALARSFRVQRAWQTAVDLADPAGDDTGPLALGSGYTYPTDPGWTGRRTMDLRRVRLDTSGGALRITLDMAHISTGWNPANGFDRVAFTLFIELPGQPGGAAVMPLQQAALPGGMRWHRRLRVHGWSNALFSDAGASASDEGTPATPGAQVQADAKAGTVSFTLPAAALGSLPSLAGARVYVTTWDYDAGYRALGPVAAPFVMGGAAPDAPKWMDEAGPMTLP